MWRKTSDFGVELCLLLPEQPRMALWGAMSLSLVYLQFKLGFGTRAGISYDRYELVVTFVTTVESARQGIPLLLITTIEQIEGTFLPKISHH